MERDVRALCNDARANRIEVLDTRNRQLGVEDVEGLCAALAVTTSVKSASLAWGLVTDAHAHHVSDALHRNQTLEDLNLKGNELTNAGLETMLEALIQSRTLRALDLGNQQQVDATGARHIGTLLRSEVGILERLNMENNPIGNEGARYIAEALTSNTSLTSLNIRGCRIGDEGAQSVAWAQRASGGLRLRCLCMGVNSISDVGIEALVDSFEDKATRLETLELDSTPIDDEGYKHIARFLLGNQTLTVLNLRGNRDPTAEAFKSLKEVFDTNMVMQDLRMILPLAQEAQIRLGCERNRKTHMILNVKVHDKQPDDLDARLWLLSLTLMSGRRWDVKVARDVTFAALRVAALEVMDPALKASTFPLRFVLPGDTVLGPQTPLSAALQVSVRANPEGLM
jgi:Ran GTPase-activating protein (RanGAP) involved in mRNA processing and transport